MAEQRMKVRDKKVQKMTKDGLVEENLTDKSSVRVSNRVGDVQMGSYSEASVDYPEYARKVCAAINDGTCDKGILICGTGIGISIAANKIKGIRAALCTDCFMAEATRLHNDANVLALGGRVIGPGLAVKITETFLTTEFSNEERHIRRINMLEN